MALRRIKRVEVTAKLGRLFPSLGENRAGVLGDGLVKTVDLFERVRPKGQVELQLAPLWPAQHLPDLIAPSPAVAHQGLVQLGKPSLVSGGGFGRRVNS